MFRIQSFDDYMNLLFSKWSRTAAWIFLLALVTRVAFIATQQDGFYFPDSLLYSQAAVDLLTQGEFGAHFDRAPAYPVFLAAVYFFFGQSIFAIRVVESFVGAFLALVMAAVARRVGGEVTGVLAGVIWALYPMGVFIAGLVYPTNLTAMLLACGVWCVLPPAQEQLSTMRAFSAGLLFGLAALTIPVVLLTVVVVAAWVFCWARHSRLWFASFLLLGAAVSLGPWTVRNMLVYGEFVPVQSGFERYLPRMRTGDTKQSSSRVEAIVRRPDVYAAHLGRNFLRFWELYPSGIKMSDQDYRERLHAQNPLVIEETIYVPNRLINAVSILSTAPIFLFALFGTVAMALRRDLRRGLSMFWAMVFSFAVGYSFFYAKIRYRIPVEPYLVILAAYGLAGVYGSFTMGFKSAPFATGSTVSRRPT